MKIFILKFFLVLSLMFLSVLFGMQQANNGIHRMKGYDDHNLKEAMSVKETPQGIEVNLLGNDFNSHDLKEKREEMEKIGAFNIFSSIGKGIAHGISKTTEKILDLLTSLLN